MRKDTRLSTLFRTASDGKLGGPGNEAMHWSLPAQANPENELFLQSLGIANDRSVCTERAYFQLLLALKSASRTSLKIPF